jgi:hypothetical protein
MTFSRETQRGYLDSDKSVLYINIIVHDASKAVELKVRTKVDDSKLPNRLKKVAANVATSVAGNVVTPDMVAKKMGLKICQKMPEKMSLRGITAVVEEVFREGPFVVFQLQVKRVDLAILAQHQLDDNSKKKKDDDHSSDKKEKAEGDIVDATAQPHDAKHWIMYWLEQFLQFIGASPQRTIEEDVLPVLIHRKLESTMGELLAEKMEEKGLDVESKVCSAATQARYFFDTLKEVQLSS